MERAGTTRNHKTKPKNELELAGTTGTIWYEIETATNWQ